MRAQFLYRPTGDDNTTFDAKNPLMSCMEGSNSEKCDLFVRKILREVLGVLVLQGTEGHDAVRAISHFMVQWVTDQEFPEEECFDTMASRILQVCKAVLGLSEASSMLDTGDELEFTQRSDDSHVKYLWKCMKEQAPWSHKVNEWENTQDTIREYGPMVATKFAALTSLDCCDVGPSAVAFFEELADDLVLLQLKLPKGACSDLLALAKTAWLLSCRSALLPLRQGEVWITLRFRR